jgi:hypothetical protein
MKKIANSFARQRVEILIILFFNSISFIGLPLLGADSISIVQASLVFLASIYCFWVLETVTSRSNQQIQLGYIFAYCMVIYQIYGLIFITYPLILRNSYAGFVFLPNALFTYFWLDIGNTFRNK